MLGTLAPDPAPKVADAIPNTGKIGELVFRADDLGIDSAMDALLDYSDSGEVFDAALRKAVERAAKGGDRDERVIDVGNEKS